MQKEILSISTKTLKKTEKIVNGNEKAISKCRFQKTKVVRTRLIIHRSGLFEI